MDIVLAILAASAFLAAAFLFATRVAAAASRRVGKRRKPRGPAVRTCPLCSSELEAGERVSSKLYPGKTDRIMHILGCPRCRPSTPTRDAALLPRRICPVCGREISRDGWVVARYFDRSRGEGTGPKAHVHVLGCTECRK